MPRVVIKQCQSFSSACSKYFDMLAVAEKHHVVCGVGHQQASTASSYRQKCHSSSFFLHTVDWATPPLWGNIFLTISTVMLTSTRACQHDILLGDKEEMPYRMTDCQAWRQRNKMTNGKKEREKASTAQLHLPFIEAVMNLLTSHSEYFKEAILDFWCTDLFAN